MAVSAVSLPVALFAEEEKTDTVLKKNGWYKEDGAYKYYKNDKAYTGWHKMGKAEGVLSKAEIDEWKLAYDVAVNGKSINSIVSDDVSPLRRLARKVLPKSVRRAIRDIIK